MSGTDVFAPHVDLGSALQRVLDDGAAYLPRVLTEDFRRRLQREAAAGAFEPLSDRVGAYQVRQEGELRVITDLDAAPGGHRGSDHSMSRALCRDLRRLRSELVGLLRERGREIDGLASWYPEQVAVQRYGAGAVGISPHRDGRRFGHLVAVFTTHGHAPFALCADRAGTVSREWRTGPGGLVLMRGPGLAGVADGRPLHAVWGPRTGTRYSVTLRMESPRERG